MDEKFAFETDKVSIAFILDGGNGLGDCITAKKVFDAIIYLVPECCIDIFYVNPAQEAFAKAFYGGSKNLNLILNYNETPMYPFEKYDLAMSVVASFAIFLARVNVQRLQIISPELLEAVKKIDEYNKQNVYDINPFSTSLASRNILLSRILNKNCYWFMSCGGALPIFDDKVNISLAPEYKSEFERLKLNKYITIYSNIGRDEVRPKVKTWSLRNLVEYVRLIKKRLPQIEVVQCGGGGILILLMPTKIFAAVI